MLREGVDQTEGNPQRKRLARDLTLRVDATSQMKNATTDTSVKDVGKLGTERLHAQRSTSETMNGMKPKYL